MNKLLKTFVGTFGLISLVILSISSVASAASFNPNDIIDNAIYNATGTMNAAQIDSFLNSFPYSCISTNNGFTTPDPEGWSSSQNQYVFGSNVSAGTAIYQAAQIYDINPQVILTTMQKEQGIITGTGGCHYTNPSPTTTCTASDGSTYSCTEACTYSGGGCVFIAMSYACPDYCATASQGFSMQLISGTWLLRWAEERAYGILTNYSGYDQGDENIWYSGPMTAGYRQRSASDSLNYYDGSYTTSDGTSVTISNGPTAALYYYTPFISGNTNFDNIFEQWFGSPYLTINISYPIGDDSVDSNGDIAIIPVVLTSPPVSTVILNYGVSNTSLAKINGNYSLTFSPSNWYLPQYITVQGLQSSQNTQNFNLQVLWINSPDGAYSQSVTQFLTTLPMLWSNTSESAVYRLYNSSTGKHAYAVSASVVSTLENNGYTLESTLGYQCQGSIDTPLVVDNADGLVRPYNSPDITNKETAQPTILFSDSNGSTFVAILKNSSTSDTLLSNSSVEINNAEQNDGYTEVTAFLLCNQNQTPVYRLYDPANSSHFYTTSTTEVSNALNYGFEFEGVGFYISSGNSLPVYRLYDPVSGSHFYTISQAESTQAQSIGYKYEGIAFYANANNNFTPIYRLYDPVSGNHFYTDSLAESNAVQSIGYKYEGIAFYAN